MSASVDFLAIVDGLRAYSESPAGKADAARILEEDRMRRQREAAALFASVVPDAYRGKGAVERCDARLLPALSWVASSDRTLLLSGKTGAGKSTLAAEIVRRHLAVACKSESTWVTGQSVAWVSAECLERDSDRFGELSPRASGVGLLVLDELAMGGERTRSVLWRRFERERLRTVITVDVRLADLERKFDAALVRRLVEDRGGHSRFAEAW